MLIKLTVNNKPVEWDVSPEARLIDFLREDLNLTGTKEGCGEGECGACTVLIDGKAVNSCLVMAFQMDGKVIETIESVEPMTETIKETFLEEGAPQCGFCMPGMVLSAKGLLLENETPNRSEVKEAISGNLCRCTGYTTIEDAIIKSSEKLGGDNE